MPRAFLVLGLLGVLAPSALADFRQSYLDGLKALERGSWAQAAAHLERAVAERAEEQPRARLVGAIPEPYLPHAYLGIAYHELGRCDSALAEWRLSEGQGAVQKVPVVHRQIVRRRADCEAKTVPRVTDEPAAASPTGPAAPAPEPVRVAPPPQSPDRETAGGPAVTAPPPGEGEVPAAELPPAVAVPGTPPGPREPLPAGVVSGVQAYFDGAYLRAIDLLSAHADSPAPRPRAVARLFRAAARHALFLLGGEEDANLLLLATADLEAARAELPAFAPHPDLFSPRFVAFFRDNP